MLSDSFVRVLRAERDGLNARVADTRQRMPNFDTAAFSDFLSDVVDPLVRAVDGVRPERADTVALTAYDVALELVGQRIAGGIARGTAIDATWRRVAPAAARIVAADPSRVLASLSNAAHQIEATPGARTNAWIDDMARLAGHCGSVDEFLRLGQVTAWRAGLAHFRPGAIAAAASLPESLALAVVGAAPSSRWTEIEAGLVRNEWFDPARPEQHVRRDGEPIRVMAMVGAFRGFGGAFLEPPRVMHAAGHFHVLSGEECWLLTADLYGATFHRVAPGDTQLPKPVSTLPRGVRLSEGPGSVTSAASNETTLAVTWSQTHHVMLIALA
jgi:hypothetical protein